MGFMWCRCRLQLFDLCCFKATVGVLGGNWRMAGFACKRLFSSKETGLPDGESAEGRMQSFVGFGRQVCISEREALYCSASDGIFPCRYQKKDKRPVAVSSFINSNKEYKHEKNADCFVFGSFVWRCFG